MSNSDELYTIWNGDEWLGTMSGNSPEDALKNYRANGHSLAFIGTAQYGSQWLAECECHDPDANWHGRRDYYGTSYTDVYDQWLDHHNEHV